MKKVTDYIIRKTMLYKTGVDFGEYAMNHVQGCAHGCQYPCYAFRMKRRFRQIKSREEWIKPKLVKNTIELLDKELKRRADKISSVHLGFSTDPFMYQYDDIAKISIDAIKLINSYDIKCSTLTKGIYPSEISNLSKINEFGITYFTNDEEYRKINEPGAAPLDIRLDSLKRLHKEGFYTWISFEPYPTPNILNQDIFEVLERIKFVDRIVFGRLNYNKKVSSYPNYKDFFNLKAKEVREFCNLNNIDCFIKKGTETK